MLAFRQSPATPKYAIGKTFGIDAARTIPEGLIMPLFSSLGHAPPIAMRHPAILLPTRNRSWKRSTDQPRSFRERFSRYRHVEHLEDGSATMAHDLGAAARRRGERKPLLARRALADLCTWLGSEAATSKMPAISAR